MNTRAPCICRLKKLGKILRNARQKITAISLLVFGIDPVKLLFNGLENQSRLVRKSAYGSIHAGHTIQRRAVAKHRSTHVRSVTTIEIRGAVIGSGVMDVGCEV